jgi:hypothetical protein
MLAIIVKYVAPQPIALKDVVAEPFARRQHAKVRMHLHHFVQIMLVINP